MSISCVTGPTPRMAVQPVGALAALQLGIALNWAGRALTACSLGTALTRRKRHSLFVVALALGEQRQHADALPAFAAKPQAAHSPGPCVEGRLVPEAATVPIEAKPLLDPVPTGLRRGALLAGRPFARCP